MLLPLKRIKFVNSIAHEGKVIIIATVDAEGTDTETGRTYRYGKLYYSVRQDGFEDNQDKTDIVGWRHWTLLPFIDEIPDPSVAEREAKDNFLLRSLYRRSGSLGAVCQPQLVSHLEHLYLFRSHREDGSILLDRFILNGLNNELMPKLQVRYKRSRQKYQANERMKVVNGQLQGVDSLDFRDANDIAFLEPTCQLGFIKNALQRQFAVCVVPTTDKSVWRWHLFVQQCDNTVGEHLRAVAVRGNAEGGFELNDQLVVDPAVDEGSRPQSRSVPGIVTRQFLLPRDVELGQGLAAASFNIQLEQETKSGPQLLKGATRMLLSFSTADRTVAALSFGLSTDGQLSLLDPQTAALNEARPATHRTIFLPLDHLENIRAVGRLNPLPRGRLRAIERGAGDALVVDSEMPSNAEPFDQVRISESASLNGLYRVEALDAMRFAVTVEGRGSDLGAWEALPKDPQAGLAFDGLVTGIERQGDRVVFTTALAHGLETDMQALVQDYPVLQGVFDVVDVGPNGFTLATRWDPVQVVNLFLQASRRKGLVFDGDGDALIAEDIPLKAPKPDAALGFSCSCWVKPGPRVRQDKQLLIGDQNGNLQLYLQDGRVHFAARLPEGWFRVSDREPLALDRWVNFAAQIERRQPSGEIELRLLRNARQVEVTQQVEENPNYDFPHLQRAALDLDGRAAYGTFIVKGAPFPGYAFTLEAWLLPRSLRAKQAIWYMDEAADGAVSLLRGGRLCFECGLTDVHNRQRNVLVDSRAEIERDEWSHVALICKLPPGASGSVQWVINGIVEPLVTLPAGYPAHRASLHVVGKGPGGGRLFDGNDRYFDGVLGNIRGWSSAKPPAEIMRTREIKLRRETLGLAFDLQNFLKIEADGEGEGGDWPAPGEVLLNGGARLVESPLRDYEVTGYVAEQAFPSYRRPAWNDRFHFGGLAAGRALSLRGGEWLELKNGETLAFDFATRSFTFETWLKASGGGVLWSMGMPQPGTMGSGQTLYLEGNELVYASGAIGMERVSLPALSDGEWHFLNARFDRSFTQSDDAFAEVFLDGVKQSFMLANAAPATVAQPFRIGGKRIDGSDPATAFSLSRMRFWGYLRSEAQMVAASEHSPHGGEKGLLAYWLLDDEGLADHGPLFNTLIAPRSCRFDACPQLCCARDDLSLTGVLSDVRLWSRPLPDDYLKQTLFVPLDGKEFNLIGYWRLGAIWEAERTVTDFSVHGNDAVVNGDIYLSADSVPRMIGTAPDAIAADAYRNDELVAVSQRAVYQDALEYRLIDADNDPITTPADTRRPFAFALRGKSSRSASEWIEHDDFAARIVSETLGEPVDPQARAGARDHGWYKAQCRFVVPDGVALLRVLGLQEVSGDWVRMEIRRHRLTHISDAISEVVYRDSLEQLPVLAASSANIDDAMKKIAADERTILAHRTRIAKLVTLIEAAEQQGESLQQRIKLASDELQRATTDFTQKSSTANALRNNPLNYYWRIRAKHSGKYLAIPRAGVSTIAVGQAQTATPVTQQSLSNRAFVTEVAVEAVGNDQIRLRFAGGSYYLAAADLGRFAFGVVQSRGTPLTVVAGADGQVKIGNVVLVDNLFQAYWQGSLREQLTSLDAARQLGGSPFRINVESSGLAVTVDAGSQADGAGLVQWTYSSPPPDNQFYYFEIVESMSCSAELDNAARAQVTAHTALVKASQDLASLTQMANQPNELEALRNEREQLEQQVNNLFSEIASRHQQSVQAISQTQNHAQALPELPANDPQQLISKGAYLGFVRADDQLSLLDSCEGQLQLSYFDRFGCLRRTGYDVTADSQNPYFEEWIPDGARLALRLGKGASLRAEHSDALQLGSEFTLEWWMKCPTDSAGSAGSAARWALSILVFPNDNRFPSVVGRDVVLDSDALLPDMQVHDAEMVVKLSAFPTQNRHDNIPLGFFTDLSPGWHHFALRKKGVQRERDIRIFVDGAERFSLTAYIESVISAAHQDASQEQITKARTELLSGLDKIDDPNQLRVDRLCEYLGDNSQALPEMAELRIWSVALDDDEIECNSKVELSGNEPDLLAYYKMNETQGTRVRNFAHADSSLDLVIDGEFTRAPMPPIIGGSPRGVTFFPTTLLPLTNRLPHATLSNQADGNGKAFPIQHIAFWVKAEFRPGSSRLTSIVDKQSTVLQFALVVDDRGELSVNSGWSGQSLSAQGWYPFGSWVHFALNMEQGRLSVYVDGRLFGYSSLPLPQFSAQQICEIDLGWFCGEMAEFVVRSAPLDEQQIAALYNRQGAIRGDAADLLVYLPFDKEDTPNRVVNEADPARSLMFDQDYGYRLHSAIDLPLVASNAIASEYTTIALDAESGQKKAMMRRFFAHPVADGVQLFCNKRIEELDLLWVGNAQFKPTLLGYIEGAPPVPSENLTVPAMLSRYGGATSVAFRSAEEVSYNWSRDQQASTGFDLDLLIGSGGDIALNAPLFGRIKIGEYKAGFKGGLSYAYSFLNSSSVTASSSLTTSDELSLSGSPEDEPAFPHLGARYIPKNVGYALVVSGFADLFVLRLRRSGRMVSYSMQANEDLPLDVNTITFLINPAYTMNGSLDGLTGTQATSQRFFRQVPAMRAQYGSLYPASYFRLWEAYELKQQIDNEDKRRAAFFENFNSRLVDETSLDRNINNSEFDPQAISIKQDIDRPQASSGNEELSQQQQLEMAKQSAAEDKQALEDQASEQAAAVKEEASKRRSEIATQIDSLDQRANADYQLARWQKKMEDLQVRAGKRNIVNTYVWDADGGLRSESQQFSNTVSHTIGGSVAMAATLGAKVEAEISTLIAGELTALATVNLTQTLTKTGSNTKGFALDVSLSGVEGSGVTDYNDDPVLPGEKVDRYRFMSYYLEGDTKHFYDFFNDVVEPEWLQSNDEEARALRQTQAGVANKTWRILHRVTYVERPALKGFGKK